MHRILMLCEILCYIATGKMIIAKALVLPAALC